MNRVEQLYGKVRLLRLLRVWHPKTQWFEPSEQALETIPEWIRRGAQRFSVRVKMQSGSYAEPDIAAVEAEQLLAEDAVLVAGPERIVVEADGSRGMRRLEHAKKV